MQKLEIAGTVTTPEIILAPEDNLFRIRGNSAPEDVRELYYPIIEWIKLFTDDILEGVITDYNEENPFKFQIDLEYFNSSSAKFLYDILFELLRLHQAGVPVIVEWYYDKEDHDMKEAGKDISALADMEFTFIAKTG